MNRFYKYNIIGIILFETMIKGICKLARQQSSRDEYLEIVNQQGEIIGLAPRSECHGDPSLMHRVSHVMVFNQAGFILLQKRAVNKDIQPGKWDTSVGGHLNVGEEFEEAAYREMKEELGIQEAPIHYLYQYVWKTDIETELVGTFYCEFTGEIHYNKDEIESIKFWNLDDLMDRIHEDTYTPNLKEEVRRYLNWKKMRTITE